MYVHYDYNNNVIMYCGYSKQQAIAALLSDVVTKEIDFKNARYIDMQQVSHILVAAQMSDYPDDDRIFFFPENNS